MTAKELRDYCKQPIIHGLANDKNAVERLAKEIVIRRLILFDDTTPYIRQPLYYQVIKEDEALKLLPNFLTLDDRLALSSSLFSGCYKRIRSTSELQIDVTERFYEGEKVINLLNGVYSVESHRMDENRDKYCFNYVLNFNYIPHSKLSQAPVFEKFVRTSLGMEQYDCLLQTIGYCLSSLQKGRKAFFLIGEGSTGKSTLLDLIESVVPKNLVAHEPLKDMATEQAKSHYRGRRLNISRDSSAEKIGHCESFKSLVSNEWTTSRELYQCSQDFVPTLKFLFGSNHPITFKHLDDAILDRLVLLLFHKKIKNEDRDLHLKEHLLAEKDVIFSLCIDSLQELIADEYTFHMSDEAESYIANQRLMLHSTEQFLMDRMDIRSDGVISSSDLNRLYQVWCQDNLVTPLDKSTFLEKVILFHPDIKRAKIGPSTKRVWGYKGIAIKSYCNQEVQTDENS